MRTTAPRRRIAFARIAEAALARSGEIVPRWLPDGRREGSEWVCRNPMRSDKHLGNMKVSLRNGRWSDFATGDRGGDLISLGAYLHTGGNMGGAARKLADMLGVDWRE